MYMYSNPLGACPKQNNVHVYELEVTHLPKCSSYCIWKSLWCPTKTIYYLVVSHLPEMQPLLYMASPRVFDLIGRP